MAVFELKALGLDRLYEQIREYPQNAEEKITGYLHAKGYERMERSIQNAIPVSARRKKHARDAKALMDREKDSNLSVTIGTREKYHYLYFPDDGSTTLHHAGNQQFFEKGVEKEETNIINEMLDLLQFGQE